MMLVKLRYVEDVNDACETKKLRYVEDVLLNPNKLPKDMYHSRKLVKGLDMVYEKIDVC
jgi:hypothetical protein